MLQREANSLARSMDFTIRQRYNWGPTDPRYLAMDDIDIVVEYKALAAYKRFLERKPLPGEGSDDDYGTTDDFEIMAWAIEHNLLDDEERAEILGLPAPEPDLPAFGWQDISDTEDV